MPPISFTVNGKRETVDVTPDTPLLWVLRENLGLTGTNPGRLRVPSRKVRIGAESRSLWRHLLISRFQVRFLVGALPGVHGLRLEPSMRCRGSVAVEVRHHVVVWRGIPASRLSHQ
jgi:hypothetical protein